MLTPIDIVRTFFLTLCNFIFTMDGAPNISPAMINTLTKLRDALRAHELALNQLIPLETRETDADERLPLSQSLYRGLQTNATIVRFVRDCCDNESHLGGILNKRMRVAFLTAQIETATTDQRRVIHEYKLATGRLWEKRRFPHLHTTPQQSW